VLVILYIYMGSNHNSWLWGRMSCHLKITDVDGATVNKVDRWVNGLNSGSE